MTEIKEIRIESLAEPAQIKLIRYARGYGWELNLHGETMAKVDEQICRIDALYQERYGKEQKPLTDVKP